jgi:poly[(R)-3-hydroxyalkanoate] polymerase subunit PhaE
MTRPAPDFLDAYQSLLRDGWETWLRQVDPKAKPGVDEKAAVARMLDGIRDYTEWLQSNAASAASATSGAPPWNPPPAFNRLSGDEAQQRFQAWLKATRDWLGASADGPHGAGHADQQALLEALADLAAQQQRYQALLGQVQAHGLGMLQQRLGAATGEASTMRSLYDAWVEVAEEAYNDAALSSEFREAYGDLTNAQVRVRNLQQEQFSRVGEQLGMPGRGDLDALARSIQDMRREIAQLRQQVAAVTSPEASTPRAKKRPPVTTTPPSVKTSPVTPTQPSKKSTRKPATKPATKATPAKKSRR